MAAPHSTKAKPRSTSRSARASAVPRTARKRVLVPDCAGQPAAEAADAVRAADLLPAPERVEVDNPSLHGRVIEHDPPAGSNATRGATVTLYVGDGAPAGESAPVDSTPLQAGGSIAQPHEPFPAAGAEDEFGLDQGAEPQHDPEDTTDLPLYDEPPTFADDEPALPHPGEDLPPIDRRPRPRRRKRIIAALAIAACVLIRALPLPHGASTQQPPRAAVLQPVRQAPAPARRPNRCHRHHHRRAHPRPVPRPAARPSAAPKSAAPVTPVAPLPAVPLPTYPAAPRQTYSPPPTAPPSPQPGEYDEFF